jgi:hypothetical protein
MQEFRTELLLVSSLDSRALTADCSFFYRSKRKNVLMRDKRSRCSIAIG